MLEVEYELKRQEGSGHERIFHTDEKLKKINGNAVYIKAPNASGKSTFLNVLALSLYGDRLSESDSRISKSLREDLEYMASRENQNFIFKVRFTSKDGKIELISTKPDFVSNDIIVSDIIDGKRRDLPFQKFIDEYFLVYDIPEDPLNRVSEILSEVKNQQSRYHRKVLEFKKFLGAVKDEIANSRNDDKINELNDSISKYELKKLDIRGSIDNIEAELQIIESFLALREFERYVEISFLLQQRIERKGKTKKVNEKNIKRFNTQFDNKRELVTEKIKMIEAYFSDLAYETENLFIEKNLDQIQEHLQILKSSNLEDCLETFQLDETFVVELEYIKSQIYDYLRDRKIKESGKKGSFYQELIQMLEQYKSMDISLPGLEKSIREFIDLLQVEYEKNKGFKLIFDKLNQCLKNIDEVEVELSKLTKELESLKMLSTKKKESESLIVNDESIESEIDDLNAKLRTVLEKVDYYTDLAEKSGISIEKHTDISELKKLRDQIFKENREFAQIFQLGEDAFLEETNKISKELETLYKRYSDIENIIQQYKDKLFDLESKEQHKYQKYYPQINQLFNKVDLLELKLAKYDGYIQNISNSQKLGSEAEIQYNEEVSYYFAKKVSEFPYIDEFIKPKKIDFLNELILLDNGREIDMKDISTGQSMSMYIQAVLKRPADDKRKMVVIFDEGSTMDSNSLKPIQEILEKQIEGNKIIYAIFAKAVDEQLTITDLV